MSSCREFSRDREYGREVSSGGDASSMKSKSVCVFIGQTSFSSLFVFSGRFLSWFGATSWLDSTTMAREHLFAKITFSFLNLLSQLGLNNLESVNWMF